MSTVTIDNKKFVVIEQKKFEQLQLLAAKKTSPAKKLSLAAGKKHALKLIDKWAKRKVTILEPAATAVAEIAFFIESKGLP